MGCTVHMFYYDHNNFSGFLTLQEHLNFICDDEKLGPVILSVKQEIEKLDGCDTQGFIRVILRYTPLTLMTCIFSACITDGLT